MEGVHGVDVSWLHHSTREHGSKSAKSSEQQTEQSGSKSPQAPAPSNGIHNGLHHLSHHSTANPSTPEKSESKSAVSTPTPVPAAKSPKESRLGLTGRRGSWMSSLSSKFSTSPNASSPGATQDAQTNSKASKSPVTEQSDPFDAKSSPRDMRKSESPASTPPGSPKPTHTFLQSALRRLSSSSGAGIGKVVGSGSGGLVPRRTMNVDPYRERCALPELDQSKLRRVSFCVDVEIAGSAQYVDDVKEDVLVSPEIQEQDPKKGKEKKAKEKKLKQSEGEALKKPEATVEKDNAGETVAVPVETDHKENTKKKEKKKRSEAERKERKEKKERDAIAKGVKPAEITHDCSDESNTGTDTPPKSQDRPTTDPLRIYRRCCQLRETPILKKIAEQISGPQACPAATPGILTCLDLSGYWMQLPDIVTLGDYLAVVPVKKLVLENCGLGDEAIRVLLAGLLACKTPEQARYNRRLVKKGRLTTEQKDAIERLGIIEKLSLKNNPKIGREGWRHVFTFVYMSRSLKAIDLSMNQFPTGTSADVPMSTILYEAISGRLAGSRLEELVMAECSLNTDCIGRIIDAVIKCGATRLGLANNDITKQGMEHIVRYVKSGFCMGLDIGGNDIHEHVDMLSEAITVDGTLWALSLADCHLSPSSLERLLPALTLLGNFRFIDLSHNRGLFASKPSLLGLIRKYVPKLKSLKRLHLMDVAMSPEHAVALADILPECRSLAHLNILENHRLTPLANAKTETEQEEACAMYASLMAAVRVSEALVCIDIDVPSPESSEIVKALAKQVVAYSLFNLERLPLNENSDSAIATMKESHDAHKGVEYPDILLHLVGHIEGFPENHDNDPPAPDNDYIVGGTGVVKALEVCLNRAERGRKDSADLSPMRSGTGTPQTAAALHDGELSKGRAKEMSKNLLGSARKIRARLQPALVKEAKEGDEMSYRRLQFLDATLRNMIQRFEEEYPETRVEPPNPITSTTQPAPLLNAKEDGAHSDTSSQLADSSLLVPGAEVDDTESVIRPGNLSRRPSSPSLASRQAQEEGRMHRIGQRIRRDILRPQTQDYAHGTTGNEPPESERLAELRQRLESYQGSEILDIFDKLGPEEAFRQLKEEGFQPPWKSNADGSGNDVDDAEGNRLLTQAFTNWSQSKREHGKSVDKSELDGDAGKEQQLKLAKALTDAETGTLTHAHQTQAGVEQ